MKRQAIVIVILVLVLIAAIMIVGMLRIQLAIALPVIGALTLANIVYGVVSPHLRPGWIKRVQKSGREASAVALSSGQDYMKGVSYSGADIWINLPARVEPEGEHPFEAKMKCRLSQSLVIKTGMKVPVRYDPDDRKKVVLVADVHALLESRLVKT